MLVLKIIVQYFAVYEIGLCLVGPIAFDKFYFTSMLEENCNLLTVWIYILFYLFEIIMLGYYTITRFCNLKIHGFWIFQIRQMHLWSRIMPGINWKQITLHLEIKMIYWLWNGMYMTCWRRFFEYIRYSFMLVL